MIARDEATGEQLQHEVKYDLPPVGGESEADQRRRRMMHRGREETALRALDLVAAACFKARRAELRRVQRERDAEVCLVVEDTRRCS